MVYTAAFAVGGYQPPGYTNQLNLGMVLLGQKLTDLNSNKGAYGQAGTSTAGIAFAIFTKCLLQQLMNNWNGSSWTEVNDLKYRKKKLRSGSGTQQQLL